MYKLISSCNDILNIVLSVFNQIKNKKNLDFNQQIVLANLNIIKFKQNHFVLLKQTREFLIELDTLLILSNLLADIF